MIKSVVFGEIQCDIYRNNDEYFMTREQIGRALEYSDPRVAIAKIHAQHSDRIDKYSAVTDLVTPGGTQETTVYNRKGIMEICRFSRQPKADAFMDWVWEVIEGLITGKKKIVDNIEQPEVPTDYLSALKALVTAEESKIELLAQNNHLQFESKIKDRQIAELKPKADYTDRILQSTGTITVSVISKDYGMSAEKFNKLLHDFKIQYKQGKIWLLYEEYQSCGYTHSKTFDYKDKAGMPQSRAQTQWTQKGRLFLYEFLKSNGILPMIERNAVTSQQGA